MLIGSCRLTSGFDLCRAVVYARKSDFASIVLFNPVVSPVAISALTALFLIVGAFLHARSETDR